MKKLIYFVVCAILVLSTLGISAASAKTETLQTEKIVFSDGSYCVTTIEELSVNENSRAQATKTGTKTNYYYNANDELQFYVVVRGTFTYNGTTATATDSNYGYSIANTAWSFVSGRSSAAANRAFASCTFHLSSAGDKTLSVALYCSPTGVLS